LAARLDLNKRYIGNVLPWRPPAIAPTNAEMELLGKAISHRQLSLMNPDLWLFLGANPLPKNLVGTTDGNLNARQNAQLLQS